MSSSLPSVHEIRQRIEAIPHEGTRYCLAAAYLFCARIGEVVAYSLEGDTDKGKKKIVRGNRLDYHEATYQPDLTNFDEVLPLMGNLILQGKPATLEAVAKMQEKAVVFTVSTQKREGRIRYVALPLNPLYEPWSQPLLDYCKIQKQSKQPFFPFNRQQTWTVARQVFAGLSYKIFSYEKRVHEEPERGKYHEVQTKDGKKAWMLTIQEHTRPFNEHALRHLRDSELINYYGFKGKDRSAYGGWTMRTTEGVSASEDRYAEFAWRAYFPKLLRKRNP